MKILKIDTNQIISVFLGVILLASVAAVLPVSAYDTNSWCNWRGSFFRDGYEKLTSAPPDLRESDDYTHVLADIYSEFHKSDGVTGQVEYFYQPQDESDPLFIDKKTLTDRGVDSVGISGTNYGIKLTRPAGVDSVEVTLICRYSGQEKTMSGFLSVENLPYELTSNDSDNDGIPDDEDGIPDEGRDCRNDPETKNGWMDSDGCSDTIPWEDAAASSMVDGMQPFFCHWTFPWTVGPGFRDEHFPDFSDGTYSNVMPAINAWGDQFGVPPLIGDVTFSYYEEGWNYEPIPIRTETVDPEYGSGTGTIPFDYGIEVMNFAKKDRPYVTLICKHEGRTVTSTQTVDATDLQYSSKLKSDGSSTSSSPSAPSAPSSSAPSSSAPSAPSSSAPSSSAPSAPSSSAPSSSAPSSSAPSSSAPSSSAPSASIPNLPGQQIISKTNLKLNAEEFTLPKNRYEQTDVVIKGIIDDHTRGVPVYVTVENPDGEAQEQKLLAADGHYMATYMIQHDFPPGKYSISAKYSGQVVDETTFVVSEYVAQVGSGTPKGLQIPSWIKNNAKWWAKGQIGDSDFVGGVQHLIKEKIIDIPDLPEQASETAEEQVPDWVRNNAGWWADGLISEDDFVNGIKWLVEKGIIKV